MAIPSNDGESRRLSMLQQRLGEGAEAVMALLDALGDRPVPGTPAEQKELLLARHRAARWIKAARALGVQP